MQPRHRAGFLYRRPIVLIAALITLSALHWLGLALLAARTRLALRTVASLPEPNRSTWPTVSIVIPARDEGTHVREALRAKLDDGYPELEVILVDDRSTDDTGDQARALGDPRLKVTRVDTLPVGWLGKVNALQRGLDASRGEWVLFSDADVHLAPGTLSRLIAWAETDGVDHVAAFPSVRPGGPLVTIALATFFRLMLTLPRLWAVQRPESKVAIGVGAFNLFRRSALQKSEGLAWLKLEIADDMALGVLLKRAGARQRVVMAQGCVSLEFYPSYRAMERALEKNGATAPAGLLLLGLTCVGLVELGYLGALLETDSLWRFTGLGTWLLAVALQVGLCRWVRLPAWPAVLPGLGILPLATAMARSSLLAWRRGGVTWRGTFYPTAAVRAGSRLRL
jgi:hypothetical protein